MSDGGQAGQAKVQSSLPWSSEHLVPQHVITTAPMNSINLYFQVLWKWKLSMLKNHFLLLIIHWHWKPPMDSDPSERFFCNYKSPLLPRELL